MIPLANHLWQSTAFAALAALMALLMRKNRAQARYWVWFAASIKFLLPFSLLVSVGGLLEWRDAPAIVPVISQAAEQVAEPFEPIPALLAVPVARETSRGWLVAPWLGGCAMLIALWVVRWRRIRAAVLAATPLPIEAPIPVLSSPSLVEPGVVGVIRPVLLMPAGITSHLTAEQLQAILAHELCHVRRRDNLAATVHMLVERIFWFHPLIWWIGARLVEERERACDEEVVSTGNRPIAYAEGILNVCKFYVRSPLECASGVTGADLKKRVAGILSGRAGQKLTAGRKMLLASAVVLSVAVPMLIGVVRGQTPAPAQGLKFDVAVIKPSEPGQRSSRLNRGAGGSLQVGNLSLKHLMTFAYDVREFQITGGPGWVDSARYDIQAKPDRPGPADPKTMSDKERMNEMEEMRVRVRALLEERFQLAVHRESKELPIYAIVIAKSGSKLEAAKGAEFSNQHMRTGRGRMDATRVTIDMLARSLSQMLGRPVRDETGLHGTFDFTLEWTPDQAVSPDEPEAADALGGSIFTAVQEQLGLKLESKKGPVDILVIDRVERPSEN